MIRLVCVASMPMVDDQAVPSEVHSTVGSDMKASPLCRGRLVWPQVTPPFEEKNCACMPLELMLFEAPMICWVLLRLTRIDDSLRGALWAPEMRSSPVSVALRLPALTPWMPGPGLRSWWESIHSQTSLRTSG